MDWGVYVGKSASMNLVIGLSEGIWGHKKLIKGIPLHDISVGDRVYFVHHLKKLKGAQYTKSSGFPRVAIEDFFGVVNRIIQVEITHDYFTSDSPVWPDSTYPHRYKFKIIEEHENCLFGMDVFPRELVESVRDSAVGHQGMAIPFSIDTPIELNDESDFIDIQKGVTEGRPILRMHFSYERDESIVSEKKKQVLKSNGRLKCEACCFDFFEAYGTRGKDFIECHHKNPLADAKGSQQTKLSDLALLCSNCHRMIHRNRPWLSVEELKTLLKEATVPQSEISEG